MFILKPFNFMFMGNSGGASSPLSGINEGSRINTTTEGGNTEPDDDNKINGGNTTTEGDNTEPDDDEEWYVIGLENKEIEVVQDSEETEYEWKVGPFPSEKEAWEWVNKFYPKGTWG